MTGFLRLILFPFSILYGIFIILRNLCFKFNILKIYKSSIPVISVGNITTGGTGKSPFVMYLAELLLNNGKSVGIISRGYKRNSEGLIIGFDGINPPQEPEKTGDELSMMIERFKSQGKRFYAIADSDRVRAVKYMESNFTPDIIILDDAYQHRYIHRDLDIVIENSVESLSDKVLIPAGNLREMKSSLRRSSLIVKNYKFNRFSESDRKSTAIRYESDGFYDNFRNKLPEGRHDKITAISGIADNKSFYEALLKYGFEVSRHFTFPDHHRYSDDDMELILKNSENNNIFLTTEKDFTKIKNFGNLIDKHHLYYLRINVICSNERIFEILQENNLV
ncbi:MAG: tetraacyldisaccharide 4'-kinase [Ignavibacteria bacterium]|nr:tetraacyldisaccharide 4'-kinase [Ignavibacteria bacterium]